jgi:hypothetical protein
MNRLVAGIFSGIALAVASAHSQASVVTRCTNPSGHAYFYSGGIVPATNAGWQRDGITNGQYLLLRDKDGGFDVVYSDAMGRTVSTKEDGGTVLIAHDAEEKIVLLVIYPKMNIETWMFMINSRGVGKVSVSQARFGDEAVARKHSLMAGDCRR